MVANGRLPDQRLAGYLQLRNTLLLVAEHLGRREVRARLILAAAGAVAGAFREPARALPVSWLEARAIEDFLRHRFGPPPGDLLRPVGWRP